MRGTSSRTDPTVSHGSPTELQLPRASRRFLLFRGLGALLLLIGLYALACAAILGLLALPLLEYQIAGQVHLAFAAGVVGISICIWMAVAPRFDEFEPPGPRLTPAAQPRLFQSIESIARAARQRVPTEIYLTNGVEAWVARRGGFLAVGSRKVMGLGLPLLQALTVPEFSAVLAHEFGHFYGSDAVLGTWVHYTRAALGRLLAEFDQGIVRRLFNAYAGFFFRWTSTISRHQEAIADALAGHVAGPDTLGRALMKVTGGSAAYRVYWTNVLRPILDAGYLPPVAAGFAAFVARPDIEATMRSAQQEELLNTSARPRDSHPPLAERLALLGSTGHEAVAPGPPAVSLLDGLEELEVALLEKVGGRGHRWDMNPVSWDDVGGAIQVPRWKRIVGRCRGGLTGVTPRALATVDGAALGAALAQCQGRRSALVHPDEAVRAGLALALVNHGFKAVFQPSGSVLLVLGDDAVDLAEVDLPLGDTSLAPGWLAFCERVGVGDVDLGALAGPAEVRS